MARRDLHRLLATALLALAVLAFPVAVTVATASAQESHGEPGAAPPHGPDATHEPGVPQSLEGTDVDAEHGGGVNAEGGHGAGLPQLDASTYPSQIFWLILSFGALYYLMTRKALPRLSEILEARQQRIAGDLDRAAKLRAEAEEAMRRHQQVVAEAQAKAAAQIKEAEERLMAEASRKQAELDADLDRKLGEAEARINAAKNAALSEIQGVAAEVAQAAVQRLAGLQVSEAEVKATLDKVMAEAA